METMADMNFEASIYNSHQSIPESVDIISILAEKQVGSDNALDNIKADIISEVKDMMEENKADIKDMMEENTDKIDSQYSEVKDKMNQVEVQISEVKTEIISEIKNLIIEALQNKNTEEWDWQ